MTEILDGNTRAGEPEPDPSALSQAGVRRRTLIQATGVAAGAATVAATVAAAAQPAMAARGTTVRAAAEATPGLPPVTVGDRLTTDQGVRVSDNQNSLRAGARGPSLLEDFHLREKLMHFDHERIPERVVHARGAGAHGTFRLSRSLERYTTARVLTDTQATTEVFVRFSTVNGSRGSADTARDARGFATKFYTSQGVWDLVGNNIPVFFIQDAIKFPDLVHAFKPEPHVEIPQASTAHDTFWDFISLTPETMHMIMWVMSDRGIPRSLRMMDGAGVHTFRLVDGRGRSTFAKFHWRPLLGVHSLVWNESQKLAGVDPDFHRRDLQQAIDAKQFPQWDFGVQLLAENEVDKVRFDVLDATKLWPEEVVPMQRVGRLTLDRNPDNYFAETEQVAFHTGNIVPGIDFTDDPLLQGRLFSYQDTQLNRFGGPNFHQLPVNQSKAPVNNFQQDASMRYANRPGRVNYEPNSLGGPVRESPAGEGGFVSYPEPVRGAKVRERSDTFGDHFSQATLFFQSLSEPEKRHTIQALQFELSKLTVRRIQERMLTLLANVDARLVREVAASLALPVPTGKVNTGIGSSPALSQEKTPRTAATRRVAILAADGVDAGHIAAVQRELAAAQASGDVVAPHLGTLAPAGGGRGIAVNATFLTTASVSYDAIYLPGGSASAAVLRGNGDALHFIEEAYKHFKAVAISGDARALLIAAVGDVTSQPGVVSGADGASVAKAFVQAVAQHRHWSRQGTDAVSA